MRFSNGVRAALTAAAVAVLSIGLVVAVSAVDRPAADPGLGEPPDGTSASARPDDRRMSDAASSCVQAWAGEVAPGSRAGLLLSALRGLVDDDAREDAVREAVVELVVQAPEEARRFYGVAECAALVGRLWWEPPQVGGDAPTPITGPCGRTACPDPPQDRPPDGRGPSGRAPDAPLPPDVRASELIAPARVCVGAGTDIVAVVRNRGAGVAGYTVRYTVDGRTFPGNRPALAAGAGDRWIAYANWTPLRPGRFEHRIDTGAGTGAATTTVDAVDCAPTAPVPDVRPAPAPQRSSSPDRPAPVSPVSPVIDGVAVENATRGGSTHLCGDEVRLVLRVDNPGTQNVSVLTQAQLVLDNGQVVFGERTPFTAEPGTGEVAWTSVLPTDWWTYPYTYDFVADVLPGDGTTGSRARTSFVMECPA